MAQASVMTRTSLPAADRTVAIELSNVSQRFVTSDGRSLTALRDFDMTVRQGEFCAVVGPTGCGKSTTLSLIAGLARPSSGTVRIKGRLVAGIDPGVGFVFQQDAVFPWHNVLDNVAAGPLFRGEGKRQALDRAGEWVRRVGLAGFEKHYPHQLSGGMRKRVALAQTFINKPDILLMDEPFSALDVQTRILMQDELLQLWSTASASVVFVTHDLEEAIALADRVFVLTAGPATVKAVYDIDLPRPRVTAEIRYQPRFMEISKVIWNDLRDEVLISYERSRRAG
jgi:NitT/TauT family transport system ATP-binding protein